MQKALRTTGLQSQSRALQAHTQRRCVAPRAQVSSTETAAKKEQPTLAIATFLASSLLAVASATPAFASEELVTTASAPTSEQNTIVAEGVELSTSTQQAPAIEIAEAAIPESFAVAVPEIAEESFAVATAAAAVPLEAPPPSANDEAIPPAPAPAPAADATKATTAPSEGPLAEAAPAALEEVGAVEVTTPADPVPVLMVTAEESEVAAAASEAPSEAAPVAVVEVLVEGAPVAEAEEAAVAPVTTVADQEVAVAAVEAVADEVAEEVVPVAAADPVTASSFLDVEAATSPTVLATEDIEVPPAQLPGALPEAVDVVPVVTTAAAAAPVAASDAAAATGASDAAGASLGASFDLPALFAAAAAAVSRGSSTSAGVSAETLTYGVLGAAVVTFVGTFFVAPRFKDSFKEPVDWRDMYTALVDKGIKTITVQDAYSKAKKGAVLLDVRLASKYDSMSAVPSINVPLYQPIAGWDLASNIRRTGFAFFGIFGTELNANFVPEVTAKVPKSKEVIVICESGGTIENKPGTQFGFQSRSLKAVYYLQRAGYSKVLHVKGGLGDWQRAGLPTTDGADEPSGASTPRGTTSGSSTSKVASAGTGKGTVAGKAGTTAGKVTARELVSATSSRGRK